MHDASPPSTPPPTSFQAPERKEKFEKKIAALEISLPIKVLCDTLGYVWIDSAQTLQVAHSVQMCKPY